MANVVREEGTHAGASARTRWRSRRSFTSRAFADFAASVARRRAATLPALECPSLEALGFLSLNRRRITLPINSALGGRIT